MKLLLGGSPCTHWSIAQSRNRETEPEGLGWELFRNYLIALKKYKPDYFLYENNKSMAPAIREQITRELGVEPIMINSALVSAQNRKRLYWTNIPGVEQPTDKGILLRDIIESALLGKPLTDREMEYMGKETKDGCNHFDFDYHCDATKNKSSCVTANIHRGVPYNVLVKPVRIGTVESGVKAVAQDSQAIRVYSPDGKSVTLSAGGGGQGGKTGLYAVPTYEARDDRKANVEDCAMFQVPHGYNKGGIKTGKSPTLTAVGSWEHNNFVEAATRKTYPVYEVKGGQITIRGKQYPIKLVDGLYIIRKLTVTECKRLQTVPEEYHFPVSNTQAYKMLGNGWTVNVIAHILSYAQGITDEPLEVLSMYDGMSCGRLALNKLGAHIVRYYATEIDKYAIQTTRHNFPDTIQLGDAFQVRDDGWHLPDEVQS